MCDVSSMYTWLQACKTPSHPQVRWVCTHQDQRGACHQAQEGHEDKEKATPQIPSTPPAVFRTETIGDDIGELFEFLHKQHKQRNYVRTSCTCRQTRQEPLSTYGLITNNKQP